MAYLVYMYKKNRIYICVKDETGFTFSVTACVIIWLESVADETEFKNLQMAFLARPTRSVGISGNVNQFSQVSKYVYVCTHAKIRELVISI